MPRLKEVQVGPETDENADLTYHARRKAAAASIQMKEAESRLDQVENNDKKKNEKHKGEMKEEKKSIDNQGNNTKVSVSAVEKPENVPIVDGL